MIKGIRVSDKNDIFLDLLRIFSCLGVIGIHTHMESIFLERLVHLGLPMFFLLSGYFLLERCNADEVLKFYHGRFLKVVLPFLCYGVFYGCWIYPAGRILVRPTKELIINGIKYIPHSVMDNLNDSIWFHFWFMYELIGLYLIFPFLGQGLKALSDKALRSLMILMMITQFLVDFLPVVGKNFPFQHYFGWVIYLVFGYAFSREYFKKKYVLFAVMGLLAFGIQLIVYRFAPDTVELIQHTSDLNPWEVLAVCGLFAFVSMISGKYYGSFQGKPTGKVYFVVKHVIGFVAAYTFSVYLIHGQVATWWSQADRMASLRVSRVNLWSMLSICIIFGASFAFSFVFDNLIVDNIVRLYAFCVSKLTAPKKQA